MAEPEKHSTFSLINVLGLAGGMAACLLILQYVYYEISFDDFHTEKENIVRLAVRNKAQDVESALLRPGFTDLLLESVPEVRSATHIYKSELQLREATNAATFIILVILVLGITNMTALNITFRTKEIGIRKVLGASLPHLYLRFVGDYLLITGLAFVLALPLPNWLENFAYRADIQWWVWMLPLALILFLVVLLVMIQTTKTCLRNPSDTLRYE